MNKSSESHDEAPATPDLAAQLASLKILSLKKAVATLERSAKEKCMLAGSLVARCAAQSAALEAERAKMAALESQEQRLGGGDVSGGGSCPVGDGGGGGELQRQPSTSSSSRSVSTQTEDDAEARAAELARLRRTRDELQAKTRGMPKNTQNMVDLLKKRNAVLLAREERGLQRLRAERLEKEQRVAQLEARLLFLKASMP